MLLSREEATCQLSSIIREFEIGGRVSGCPGYPETEQAPVPLDSLAEQPGGRNERANEVGIAVLTAVLGLVLAVPANSQDPVPPVESLEGAFPAQKHYSPYAGRNFPTQVFWGDTHLHTGMSMDAGAFGARLTPEDAYRFARGEELTSSTGQQVKLRGRSTSWSWRTTRTTWVSSRGSSPGTGDAGRSDRQEVVRHDPGGWADGRPGRRRDHRRLFAEHVPRGTGVEAGHALPTARPGKRRSTPPRSTTTPGDSPPSSATSGPPTPAATTCTAC